MRKFLDMTRLDEKVHLLLGDIPHLVHQCAEVHDIVAADETDESGGTLHEREVSTHDLMDAGTLHLDDDFLARGERGAVCLRDAGRAERRAVDRAKDLVPVAVVLLLDDGEDDGEGERTCRCLELHQFIAVLRRQKVGAHAHDLAELDKCWPEILEDGAQFFRREAVDDVVTSQYRYHLTQPQRGVFVFGALQQYAEHRLTSLRMGSYT